jgi:hypothetical protein
MIDDDRLHKALSFLATTDERCANLRADMERAEFKAKAIKDAIFKRLDGSVADRSAEAGASEEYGQAMAGYFDALRDYEALRNKRATEAIVIDTWRTIQANQRRGNI